MENRKIRVLLAKPGLDGHQRGIKIIARALRDAGMEVIYTGLRQTPEMIAQTALQEDVDVIGLSILSGSHLELLPIIMKELRRRGLRKKMVLVGGVIYKKDIPLLKKRGVKEIFNPGTTTKEIIDFIRTSLSARTLIR